MVSPSPAALLRVKTGVYRHHSAVVAVRELELERTLGLDPGPDRQTVPFSVGCSVAVTVAVAFRL